MRQQETTPPPPAVAEFRASQNLLNPNVRVAQFVDSRFKRFQLIKMLNNGVKITHAARSLQISVTGARHIRDRVIELNLLRNRRTPKRVLADYQTNHLIVTTLREQRKIKTKQLLHVLHDQGIPISLRQLRYRISMLGFRYRKMKRVQVISKHNQLKRLLAREFWRKEGYPFSRYLFVDESTVVLGREQEWCWVQKGEQIPCQGRVRHGEGFHVFGGISWFGATDVLVWRSKARMNSAFYCAHNIKDVVAEAKNIFPGGAFELVQDNHKAHVSFETCEFLRKLGINTYDWPPQSPEWNPIEYVWRDMKAYIAERSPTSLDALQGLIEEFWKTKVTPVYCRKVIRLAMRNVERSFDGLNHEKDVARNTVYQK